MTLRKVFMPAVLFCGAVLHPSIVRQTIFAQVKTATGGGTTTTAPSVGTPSRSPLPTNNPTTNTSTPYPTVQRPIFLSGKVLIEGGLPLPSGISIERVCGSGTRTVAYTDTKGHFQFEWGRIQGVLPDASNSTSMREMNGSGLGSMDSSTSLGSQNQASLLGQSAMGQSSESEMMNCELRAVVAGYRSDSINLAGHRSLDNPEVGSILLHRMGNVEGTSISATSFNAPKDARKAFDRGIESMHKGKPEDATRNFEKAVDAYPKYADAWYQLGRMRSAADDQNGAREAYVKALDADSKLVGPCVELGLMSIRTKNWPEAVQYLDRAVRLDPIDFPQAWFGNAVAHFNLKSYDSAEKSVREALKLDPKRQNPRAGYLLGLILAEKQDFAGATVQLREFLKFSPNVNDADTIRKQLGQLEKLASTRQEQTERTQPDLQ